MTKAPGVHRGLIVARKVDATSGRPNADTASTYFGLTSPNRATQISSCGHFAAHSGVT
jgi:hypothetical protein